MRYTYIYPTIFILIIIPGYIFIKITSWIDASKYPSRSQQIFINGFFAPAMMDFSILSQGFELSLIPGPSDPGSQNP